MVPPSIAHGAFSNVQALLPGALANVAHSFSDISGADRAPTLRATGADLCSPMTSTVACAGGGRCKNGASRQDLGLQWP